MTDGFGRTLAAAFTEKIGHRDGLATLALLDRSEQDLFGVGIDLEGFVGFTSDDRDRRALRQLAVQFNPPADNLAGCDLHEAILAALDRRFPERPNSFANRKEVNEVF